MMNKVICNMKLHVIGLSWDLYRVATVREKSGKIRFYSRLGKVMEVCIRSGCF